MRKGLTEVVFILDRSGSMRGLEADTIGGFNSMIEKQQKEEGEAFISTILFDDQTEVLYDRVPIGKVEPMNDNQYYVRGCTALLDAIGGAIHHIGNVHKYARPEDIPEKTLFIITTDGMENASRKYDYKKVKRMIEDEKKKYHWEFIFLGANIDAVEVAGRFGVSANSAVRFENDSMGAELNYMTMSKIVSCARAASSAEDMEDIFESDEMLAEIREDYADYEQASKSKETYINVTDDEIDMIKDIMPNLSEREQDVAGFIFGLDGKTGHTFSEGESRFGIPDIRVHQIASKVLRKAKMNKKGRC